MNPVKMSSSFQSFFMMDSDTALNHYSQSEILHVSPLKDFTANITTMDEILVSNNVNESYQAVLGLSCGT